MEGDIEKLSKIFGLVAVLVFVLMGAQQAWIHQNLDVLGSMWFVILLGILALFGMDLWKSDSTMVFGITLIALIIALIAAMMYINNGFQLAFLGLM